MGPFDTILTPRVPMSGIIASRARTFPRLPRRRALPPHHEVTVVGEPAPTVVLDAPAWVLLHAEAQARGFKNPLAFRRWLRRRQVPVRRDGHRLWVRREDVDRAIEGLDQEAPAGTVNTAVSEAVAAITRRR